MSAILIIILLNGDVKNTTTIEFRNMLSCEIAKSTLLSKNQLRSLQATRQPIIECFTK